jgi:pyruvate-ferredoxin/flavodoxin oxidoreductase
MTQLFGDRAIVANATGCSSIYGGNLPTTPWTTNSDGRGPAWSNSLFEDNAEFGLGMRLALDKQAEYARELVSEMAERLDDDLAHELLKTGVGSAEEIAAQRKRVARLKEMLHGDADHRARDLVGLADALVPRSVWIVGGDGWAYDIGFGGLDHVLASGANVNVLVLDTEVYSNTGGQMSKATPRGAVAKFAAAGKSLPKKDLGMMAMSYGSVYAARVAMGADDTHTLHVFQEAESYPGPSLIIAYSQCIAHGYDLAFGMQQQKAAVETGYWPLFRYDPRREDDGKNPFTLDSKRSDLALREYMYKEGRYNMLVHKDPKRAEELLRLAQADVDARWRVYEDMAQGTTA